ncbi:division/cell wall cluster transcriptional repressor MraZ [Moheibacter lacus]|uniref:Transcriptional regulator MraZ n=1 Tax=Moheibacter lacus TaxID=2745851 RepID=A0A838ZLZ3_9FLAO|nr:division/cell wall cluster transcriptional repressor MraZ [Moheibacter lacus]MBA5629524.1 division/cell wall cluster transcriptional repressor MraZ [Moheibacter lacus]
MKPLIGTHECKVDAKGRLPLPSGLKKQLAGVLEDGFVLKRSVFQKCLELHPMGEWNKVMEDVNKLNRFVKKNNDFVRLFTAGLKVVEVDGNGRIQIAKDLISYAGIDKEVVLSPNAMVLEIWDKDSYEKVVDIEELDFASLAEEVMGNVKNEEDGVS